METETITKNTNRIGDPNYQICNRCAYGTGRMLRFSADEVNIGRQLNKPYNFMYCVNKKCYLSKSQLNRNKCPFGPNNFIEKTTKASSK